MPFNVEDLEDSSKFRKMLEIPYSGLVDFILDYIRKRSAVNFFFWSVCILFFALAIYIRIGISGNFVFPKIILHSLIGIIGLPVVSVPVHEFLHVIPFYLFGARNIRAGMDLRQYIFYVTAHRYVAAPFQFMLVAFFPFLVVSMIVLLLVFTVPGIWKWSFSLFLFLHATMCAGDFALLNFYWLNRTKKIYTWDDAERKISYFYESVEEG